MYTHQKQSIMLTALYRISPFLLQQVCEVKRFSTLFLLMGRLRPQDVKWLFQAK